MSITPKAIQDLLDELEASKQSRLPVRKTACRRATFQSRVPCSIEKMKSCREAYRSVEDAPVRDDFALRQYAAAIIDS
jgi:hypothetical protein